MVDSARIIPRHLSIELGEALTYSRIVNIIGPREVGKTTLVREIFQQGTFISLDDPVILSALEFDPFGYLSDMTQKLHDKPLIIDEAQRTNVLPLAIKRIVDENNRPGQFVLTGSSNIFTTYNVADSLAGRVRTLHLWPLTITEIKKQTPSRILDWGFSANPDLSELPDPDQLDRREYIDILLAGGFPELRELNIKNRQMQYRDHIHTIVDRDVAHIFTIRKSDALRRLIEQLSVRTGNELNIAELCKSVAIRRNTMETYLDILLKLSIVTKLGAWTSGKANREVKNAKSNFVDTGIACALRHLDEDSFAIDANPTAIGGLLESFVYAELLRAAPHQNKVPRFYHWRDGRGREIDILAESASRLIGIEVKASSSVTSQDFKHLHWFASEGPGKKYGITLIIFYLGREKLRFGNHAFALPVSILWGTS